LIGYGSRHAIWLRFLIGRALWHWRCSSSPAVPVPAASAHAPAEGRPDMMDVIYLGLIVGFLALSWGLVELCDRL
jgi:hypothetical protein